MIFAARAEFYSWNKADTKKRRTPYPRLNYSLHKIRTMAPRRGISKTSSRPVPGIVIRVSVDNTNNYNRNMLGSRTCHQLARRYRADSGLTRLSSKLNCHKFQNNSFNKNILYRYVASSSGRENDGNDADNIHQYLQQTMNIEADLHDGIIKALESIHGKGLVRMEHVKSFGKEGMEALALSVEQERQRYGMSNKSNNNKMKSRPFVSLRIKIPHHSSEFNVKWRLGDTILDVAKQNEDLFGEYMEGTCGGNMSCCTCHVYIEQDEFRTKYLDAPTESELDMIDLAYDPKDTSRLGCQVTLTQKMIDSSLDLEVTIPEGVNNVWN